MRLGSHLSVAGGVARAVEAAQELKLECVQIFTANQRQWSPKSPTDEEVREWFQVMKAAGWDDPEDGRAVSHNSYLVNLASPEETNRTRSIDLQRRELERCEALAIRRAVMHPGAHLGERPARERPEARRDACTPDELAGLKRLAASLDQLHRDLPGYKVITCLENTVGAGTALGYDFRHLDLVRSMVREPERVAYCFDTCHATAAGYDMTTAKSAAAVVELMESVLGRSRVLVFHLNDSKGEVGSRLDRHEHIGDGRCADACFQAVLRHGDWEKTPGILETPKEGSYKRKPWDLENVQRLRRLAGKVAKPKSAAKPQKASKRSRTHSVESK